MLCKYFGHFCIKKRWKKLLKYEIRFDHSLANRKKLQSAAARCVGENQNYTSEYGQCPPAFRIRFVNVLIKASATMENKQITLD